MLDVGIAGIAAEVPELGGHADRAAYAAPEQLTAPARRERTSDLFSLGVLAFELLTQRRLFVGGDRAVVQKVQRQKIPPLRGLSGVALPEVPAALAEAVEAAL